MREKEGGGRLIGEGGQGGEEEGGKREREERGRLGGVPRREPLEVRPLSSPSWVSCAVFLFLMVPFACAKVTAIGCLLSLEVLHPLYTPLSHNTLTPPTGEGLPLPSLGVRPSPFLLGFLVRLFIS